MCILFDRKNTPHGIGWAVSVVCFRLGVFSFPNVTIFGYSLDMETNQPTTTKRIATLALILSLVIMGNAARPTRIETGVTSEETA